MLVVNSVIGIFYYLRIITAMFIRADESDEAAFLGLSFAGCFVIWVLTALVTWWEIFPSSLVNLILRTMTEGA